MALKKNGFIVIYNICGMNWRLIHTLYAAGLMGVDTVVFLGNTCSLDIIEDSINTGFKVYGVKGNLDDYSVIKALKKHDGFVEGRITSINSLKTAFLGEQVLNDYERIKKEASLHESIDVLLTLYPPVHYHEWCNSRNCPGSIVVDELIELLKPQIIVVGKNYTTNNISENLFFTGDARRGEFIIVYRDKDRIQVLKQVLNF